MIYLPQFQNFQNHLLPHPLRLLHLHTSPSTTKSTKNNPKFPSSSSLHIPLKPNKIQSPTSSLSSTKKIKKRNHFGQLNTLHDTPPNWVPYHLQNLKTTKPQTPRRFSPKPKPKTTTNLTRSTTCRKRSQITNYSKRISY